jgi:small subunit ribosomal protein S4
MRTKSSGVKKYRVQRRLNTDLPGLGKPGALERRPFAPGQHGSGRRKLSEYALRLSEKQKLIAHYQLTEQQLQRFVKDSRKAEINWISELSRRLELRLDNLVFRLQMAPSIRSARQLVRHGHILLNGKRANIGSIVVNVGDEIQIKETKKEHPSVVQATGSPRLDLPAYLEKLEPTKGKVVAAPTTSDIPFAYSHRLIAEYYATRGAK